MGWLPWVPGSWSSALPATSLAPMVTTALYLVLLANRVEELPKGLRTPFRPSELGVTVTFVIPVVLPSALTLESLKVASLIDVLFICSEKVAVTLPLHMTPVLPFSGLTRATFGAVVSEAVPV